MNMEQIGADYLKARKEGNELAKGLLSTLIADIEKTAKDARVEIQQVHIVNSVKKFVNGCKEIIEKAVGATADRAKTKAQAELDILKSYIPEQMSIEEIEVKAKEAIAEIGATSKKEMGKVMSLLKLKFGGTYDAKVASDIVKKNLK